MTEGISWEIRFKTIQPEIMKLIIDYMYAKPISIQTSSIQNIIQTSDYLEIFKLRDETLHQVATAQRSSPETVVY